jgi:hypothetical protein
MSKANDGGSRSTPQATACPSSLLDTRVIYCGDNLEQLKKLPDACIDLVYIDLPFNSNRNYEVFWGETREKRSFDDRHESTQAYIDFMRPRCFQLARVLKKTGSFYYHCDWHASHYVKVMLDQIFGENNFQNEIVWKRTTAHADTHGFGHVHDILFRYSNGDARVPHPSLPLARVGSLILTLILLSTLILFLQLWVFVPLFLFLSLCCHSAVRNPSGAQISCAAPSFASTS